MALGKTKGNLVWFSSVFHAPVISTAPTVPDPLLRIPHLYDFTDMVTLLAGIAFQLDQRVDPCGARPARSRQCVADPKYALPMRLVAVSNACVAVTGGWPRR